MIDIMEIDQEMLIRIIYSFLNRNINIIMDHCYNGNPKVEVVGHQGSS